MKLTMKAAFAMGAAAMAVSGCSHKESGTTTVVSNNSTAPAAGTASSDGGGKTVLAFITNNASDYWTIAQKGVAKAQKELPNFDVEYKVDGGGTADEQKTIIDDLLVKGCKGFAISPVDPANQTQVLNDAASKATVITQDSDAPKSNRACYIGTDNHAAGVQAGQLMMKALPNGGKIMLFVGKADAQNAHDRISGIQDAIKGSKIQILDVRTDNTDHTKAKSNVAEAIIKYPDLAGCMGIWSYNGPAILNAVKSANKTGQIKIVCFDQEKETLAGVKSGEIYATVVQQPFEFGYRAMKMLAAIAGGNKSVIPASKQEIVPTLAIQQNNEAAYEATVKQEMGQ